MSGLAEHNILFERTVRAISARARSKCLSQMQMIYISEALGNQHDDHAIIDLVQSLLRIEITELWHLFWYVEPRFNNMVWQFDIIPKTISNSTQSFLRFNNSKSSAL